MPRYDFSFAWESSYGHVVKLIQRLGLERGVVIDLGCGFGSIAEPLRELGYEYVGADIDEEALKEVSQRGFDAHNVDLAQTEDLAERMAELANGRTTTAVLLLDVIEHMPATRSFMAAVRGGLELLGRPPLLVSVPNIAHVDVGAKLTFGRWDYTTTGLLDSTHLQFFTSDRLQAEARACGLLEIDANDLQLRSSDQHFPDDHPALSFESPIAQAIRMWRDAADAHGQTVQFVRAFLPCATDPQHVEPAPTEALNDTSSITVVMRTQGKRSTTLRDALTCLAAQTCDSFAVLLMVHSERPEVVAPAVTDIVDEFDSSFSSRVRVVPVGGGGRARPLNVALDQLKSEYVTFLDDDDLVTANWVESFLDAANEGAIVRSAAAVRHVSAPIDSQHTPYVVHSSLEFRYNLEFDRIHHFWGNDTPICTFAVPRHLIEAFGLRFDEQLPVLEDWDFLLRCVALAPVHDTREVTSIYQMWQEGESSASLHDPGLWQATQRALQDRANLKPVVLPQGSVARLIKMSEQVAELEQMRPELSAAHGAARLHAEIAGRLTQELENLRSEFEKVHREYLITISSRRWRVLAPVAWAAAALRGGRKRR